MQIFLSISKQQTYVDLGLEKRETIKKWLLVGLRWPRFVTVSWRKHGGFITWILVKLWH
jgi:hypothetical protein